MLCPSWYYRILRDTVLEYCENHGCLAFYYCTIRSTPVTRRRWHPAPARAPPRCRVLRTAAPGPGPGPGAPTCAACRDPGPESWVWGAFIHRESPPHGESIILDPRQLRIQGLAAAKIPSGRGRRAQDKDRARVEGPEGGDGGVGSNRLAQQARPAGPPYANRATRHSAAPNHAASSV
jgi:hypothetical protein